MRFFFKLTQISYYLFFINLFSIFFFFFHLQNPHASDDIEVVKAIAPEEGNERGDDSDQVALESVDQDGSPTLLYQQHPPPPQYSIISF